MPIRAYPCLSVVRNEVVLTTENNSDVAESNHRQGTLALLRQQLSGLDRDLRQEVQKRMKPHWLLAKGMGTEQELTRMIVDAVITHVLIP